METHRYVDRTMNEDNTGDRSNAGFRQYTRDDGESPSTAVVFGVASATGTDPDSLPPLTSAIDPDALNELYVSEAADLRVEFKYAGCLVVVENCSDIFVYPP